MVPTTRPATTGSWATAWCTASAFATGKAEWYRNRWVRSADVASRLGEPSPAGRGARRLGLRANTNVIGHAGRTFAIVEAGARPVRADLRARHHRPLRFRRHAARRLHRASQARPRHRRAARRVLLLGLGQRVQYSVLGTDGRVRRMVDIEVTGSPMMHDFALTERHVVFFDLPVTFDVDAAETCHARCGGSPRFDAPRVRRPRRTPPVAPTSSRRSGGDTQPFPYRWDPSYPARVGVMPREGEADDVRWFDVEPCYVFHPLNAYDDGDRIVIDVVRHPKMFDAEPLGPERGRRRRWTVDHRHRRGQGHRGALRRPRPGVPARRRAGRRPPPPLRLHGRLRPQRQRRRRAIRPALQA